MERALARWPGPLLLRRARAPTREPPYPRTPGAGVPGSHQQTKRPLGSDRLRRTPKDEEDPN
ncbi:hypothetical protein Celaphus_00015544 [Cervus elaphus hippelaphus]|uniref:Uncharacterized protein n=1 Tax=Cervus elaphus hippelaphus TaxID=46360 RepID=A0A212CT37_CEREH|nr:hypothetical protein Celaphus_00015544 [Cervus elaphus hippelaphus]